MADTQKHHALLIERACRDGWIRGHNWRAALRQAAQGNLRWEGDYIGLEECFDFSIPRPDAWRIVDEGRLCVLEFLEVEVTGGITKEKDELYRYLWDMFDASSCFHLRIWHMDRFGIIRPYITTSSHAEMIPGMNAGWRN